MNKEPTDQRNSNVCITDPDTAFVENILSAKRKYGFDTENSADPHELLQQIFKTDGK